MGLFFFVVVHKNSTFCISMLFQFRVLSFWNKGFFSCYESVGIEI